ncbi:hypothetical protein GTO89_05420 [Heliobacterium gestii]|uniref:Uncharacterized protein n=1 Tax=Heliomicrobium gestii TaxID=2699 RepID=A0A845LCW3_HELGE|nr:hypothetical protein [Heliomicrobium gestii]MBM7866195.1 hypothetical protein [Heliomicrobium gestii]MZP42479.1 hypothetical protein [Heliomicrobium gestii]
MTLNPEWFLYLGAVPVVLIFSYFLFRFWSSRKYRLAAGKVQPEASILLVTKNSENLTDHVLQRLLQAKDRFKSVTVIDLGSIDKTVEKAQERLADVQGKEIIPLLNRLSLESPFNRIKPRLDDDVVLVVNVARLAERNPNVYVPDLFLPLEDILTKNLPAPDNRIDGVNLLYLDRMEREKNRHVLNEYITVTLSNIRMRLEAFAEKGKLAPERMEAHLQEMQAYLDRSITHLQQLTLLLGPADLAGESVEGRLLSLFDGFSRDYQVSINFDVSGSAVNPPEPIALLVVSICQELLYTLFQSNLSSAIQVQAHFRRKELQLLFRFLAPREKAERWFQPDQGLPYHVLHSIQNRLALIGGKLRLHVKGSEKVSIYVRLPIDQLKRQPSPAG